MSSNPEQFNKDLKEVTRDAERGMRNLDVQSVEEGIAWAADIEKMDNVDIEELGDNLVRAIHAESEKIYSESELDELREQEALLSVTRGAMTKAISRIESVMGSFEGKDVSNEVEVREYWQRVYGVLIQIDAQQLMLEAASETEGGDLVLSYYEMMGEYVPKDLTVLVQGIIENDLDNSDREMIVDEVMKMSRNQQSFEIFLESNREIHMANASLLLLNLKENPVEKANVMEMIVFEAGGPKAIFDLTVGGYLTVTEAKSLYEMALNGEHDQDRVTQMEGFLEYLDGDRMVEVQERREEMQQELVKRLPLMVGHKNQALEKLSLRGIAGTYLKLIAASGILFNVLANIQDPIDGILMNPMIGVALGAGTLGAAIDPSDINVWPKPGTHLSSVLRDGTELDGAKEEEEFANFRQSILNHPQEAELYYSMTDEIVGYYRDQMTAGVPLVDIKVDFDAMGVDYDQLPEHFRTRSQENYEARLTDWAQTFMYNTGLSLRSADEQQRYMNKAREDSELLHGDWQAYDLTDAL